MNLRYENIMTAYMLYTHTFYTLYVLHVMWRAFNKLMRFMQVDHKIITARIYNSIYIQDQMRNNSLNTCMYY